MNKLNKATGKRAFYRQISWSWTLCAAASFLVPFFFHYSYILNLFYNLGAPYFDLGLLMQLVWHNDLSLTMPRPLGTTSFMWVHFSPFLWVVNLISYIVPAPMVEFFAGYMAAIYAALSLAVFCALKIIARTRSVWVTLGLALLATGFAFHGVILQGIWMPHFEYVIPLGIFCFLLAYARGYSRLSILLFIVTLGLREDAGFQLTAVLGLWAALKYYRLRNFAAIRREAIFIGFACAYSFATLWLIHYMRDQMGLHPSVFSMIYTGEPAYAHLNGTLLLNRLKVLVTERVYLWLGCLFIAAWAFYKRTPALLIGIMAYIPWFLVNWTAYNGNTGILYAYYVFPMVMSMLWPLICVLLEHPYPLPQPVARQTLYLQTAIIIAGLVMWNPYSRTFMPGVDFWVYQGSFLPQNGTQHREQIQDLTAQILTDHTSLGTVMVDAGMMSLTKGSARGMDLVEMREDRPVDTVFYMPSLEQWAQDAIRDKRERNHLSHHYCLPDAPVCAYTNRAEDQLGDFSPLLKARDPQPAS